MEANSASSGIGTSNIIFEFYMFCAKEINLNFLSLQVCHTVCAAICVAVLIFSNCEDKKHPFILATAISQFALMAYVEYVNQQHQKHGYNKRVD